MTETPPSHEPEREPGADWAQRLHSDDPAEWKRVREEQRAWFREHGREVFGPLRFLVPPMILTMATYFWARDRFRRVILRRN